MNIQCITPSPFESLRQLKDGQEHWSARDLQKLLGYTEWRNFEMTIKKAMAACRNVGQRPEDHFGDAPKLIKAGKGATREVTDYQLTRYACYLTAMNGDPRKSEIAQAPNLLRNQNVSSGNAPTSTTNTSTHAHRCTA